MAHPQVPIGPSEAPSAVTRGRFSRHFGEAPAGAVAAPRAPKIVPFSKQAVAPRLGLDSVLLAFGFSSREEAELLGRQVLLDRASAQAKAAGAADPEAEG